MSIQLTISPMRCAACVSKIEQALSTVAGVTSVRTNLALKQAEVDGDVDVDSLIQALAAAGYDASERLTDWMTFSVPAMRCAACVGRIESALTGVAGVDEVRTDLASKQVLIHSTLEPVELEQQLRQAGYPGHWQESQDDEPLRQQAQQQLTRLRRDSAVALLLGGGLMLWAWAGMPMTVDTPLQQLAWGLVGVVTLAVMAICGGHFYRGAWQALRHRSATMDTLIALGTGSAWLFSMAVVLMPDAFPAVSRHLYFEASAMIIGLINLGQALEQKAKRQTNSALRALLALAPKTAWVLVDGREQQRPLYQVRVGERLRLKPGEQVPVDGSVIAGETFVDESMLTGEPVAVAKGVGDTVSAGTLNKQGTLVLEATRVGRQTALAQIIRLVRTAQSSKLPIASLADRVASVFVPVVVVIALFSASLWYLWGPAPAASHALVVLTTVLIIACPCALGLATPMSVINAVGKAAQMGLLIRTGESLQQAADLDILVVDKTGTLTQGQPVVTDVMVLAHYHEAEVLSWAASLEQGSEHPLAEAVMARAQQQQLPLLAVSRFQAITGLGVQGEVDGVAMALGNGEMMAQLGVGVEGVAELMTSLAAQGKTPVYLARDGVVVALLAIADPLRDDARQAVAQLQSMGLQIMMLTGDHQTTAAAIATELTLDRFEAQMKPADKARVIARLQQQGLKVAMAGDGINDAPSLAAADVGFAMGSGTDVAKESADIILVKPSLFGVAKTIALSRATLSNIRQNLFGAFVYNSLGIPIAAGVLYPLTGSLLSPVVAAAAMALSSVTVVSNANRLKRFRWSPHQ
ncbi:heavy metal translocating P-type ATPase [Ferrimonas sp. SCSIO 43195]|uniref:heavy metal translocating P-type ATPase n=1 Tax=Ferrimonas sp. SCSIO 43195 TaxID=2822844 RepID=UPI002075659E|nr:heavy metal translocating P-type ATPase [Ferrimonas sp. SCSIO 43195]USD36136.1 copper-translocating P-type ATPase [Ferrimonas sp. SCSIO 43195]